MKELCFIKEGPAETLRNRELQRSKALSHKATLQHRQRKQRQKQLQLRKSGRKPGLSDNGSAKRTTTIPVLLTAPTGCYISMPFLPGSLKLNLSRPTTRDVLIVQQVEAWQWYTTRPYFSRISYIFNLTNDARNAHEPPKPFDATSTFSIYLCRQWFVEHSISLDQPPSQDVLGLKALALGRMYDRSESIIDTFDILTDAMHMAMLEMVESDGESSTAQVHLKFVEDQLKSRKRPKTRVESNLWRQAAFMIGNSQLLPEWSTHYCAEEVKLHKVPPGFGELAAKLSGRSVANIERAHRILCSGSRPLSAEDIETLPSSETPFSDIFQAIDSYRIGKTRAPKLPQMIDLAILVLAAEDSTSRALTGVYEIARIYLARVVQNFHPRDQREHQCQIWAWMVSITSWRNINDELAHQGLTLLIRLWTMAPLSQNWVFAETIAKRFLWTPLIALRLRRDWQRYSARKPAMCTSLTSAHALLMKQN